MKLRATGLIGQDDDGHIVLEIKKDQDMTAIKNHVGEEVELVIMTREAAARSQSASSGKESTEPTACAKPGYWNTEDQS